MTGTHTMLDLETMGTGVDAAVLSIGAVRFPVDGPDVEPPSLASRDNAARFHTHVTLESSLAHGLKIDPGTLFWWLKQSEEARSALVRGQDGADTLGGALADFQRWMGLAPVAGIWCHGATFDVPILGHAYSRWGGAAPWDFRAVRDTRTLFDVYEALTGSPPPWPDNPVKHSALWDAWAQAVAVQRCWRRLSPLRDRLVGVSEVVMSEAGAPS